MATDLCTTIGDTCLTMSPGFAARGKH